MYMRLGTVPPVPRVNLSARGVIASQHKPFRRGLQGLAGTAPSIYQGGSWSAAQIQSQWDAAQSVAPGFLGPGPAAPSPPPGYVMIWWPSPAGQYAMFVPQGSIADMPNGGAVYTASQAGASAASGRDPNTGFTIVPGITIQGGPVYRAVYMPASTRAVDQPPPPVMAAQDPRGTMPTWGTVVNATGSQVAAAPPASQLSIPGTTAGTATTATIATAVNASSTAGAGAADSNTPVAPQGMTTDQGGVAVMLQPNYLVWGAVALAAYFMLRR